MSLPPPPLDPQPLRAQPLEYANPLELPFRPGILTALAVMSIIVASLGLLFSMLFAAGISRVTIGPTARVRLTTPSPSQTAAARAQARQAAQNASAVVAQAQRQMAETRAALEAMRGGSATAPATAPTTTVSRMSASNRRMVIEVANSRDPLSPARQEMLDLLLSQTGDDVFPFREADFTPDSLRKAIFGPGAGTRSEEAPQNFSTVNGYIRVADDYATFDGRTQRALRVQRPGTAIVPPATLPRTPTYTPPPPPPPPSRVAAILVVAIELGSVALSSYLLFCGIVVFRGSRSAYRHHLNYARLKILLVGAALGGLLTVNLSGPNQTELSFLAGFTVVLGWIYPIAVLIVLRRKDVIRYYRSLMGRPMPT